MHSPEPRPFTGRHAAIMIVSFFAVVIIVNLVMARFAISTFGGTVVDNSYVASQQYDQWLARAEAGERLGWQVTSALDARRHVIVRAARRDGAALNDAILAARAHHVLGQSGEVQMDFTALGNGQFRSTQPLPAGRWQAVVTIHHGADMRRTAWAFE